MKIGLVLHRTPAYSETFFVNKIQFLQSAGHTVVLFVEHQDGFNACAVKTGFAYKGISLKTWFRLSKSIIQLLIHPIQTAELFQLNKKDGISLKQNLVSLIGSAHIIGNRLDWLHFGFAETAISKENIAGIIGSRMAVSVRGYDLALYPMKRSGCYVHVWEKLDHLHHLSDHLLQLAVKDGFNPELKKATKITPAVDLTNLPYTTKTKTLPDSPIRILTIARLHWIKGLDDTLIALSLLKNVNFEYHILGDGPEKERLQFLVRDLNLDKRIYLHGKQPTDKVRKHLSEAEFYIQYSEHEGFCNALLEAQAAGLIAIGADNSALRENIIHKETGFLVPSHHPQKLADTLQLAIEMSEEQKDAMRQKARLRIEKDFSLHTQKEQFLKFYQI